MAKANWNGVTVAESDDIVLLEGNVYFPRRDIDWGFVQLSDETEPTFCHWKGTAEYYDLFVHGESNPGAAWCYPQPFPAAAPIAGRLAFWRGVEVTGAPEGRGLVEPADSPRGELSGWQALCWYLKATDKSAATPADIAAATGIPEADLAETWQHPDVQRYARHYGWKLTLRLEKTAR